MSDKNFYPFNHSELVLADGDMAVVRARLGHLCGYVAFPAAETPAEWAGNYDADGLQYLAIHGGPTFAKTYDGWCVFGFDCAHCDDDDNPALQDPEHVMRLARQMRDQMVAYRKRLMEWRAADREGRAQIIDEIRGIATVPCDFGFGALLGMIGGAPELGPKDGMADKAQT